jgi:hypothetical protein
MMTTEDKGLLMSQVDTDVSLLSFLSAISVFFVGALLSKFDSSNLTVKVPISFLIISTFAFFFSAIIISNANQKIIEGNFQKVKEFFVWGYAISEYLGIFLFVVSIPLAISIITADTYLRVATFASAILGLGFYQFMGFSILESQFSKSFRALSILLLLLSVGLFVSQILDFHFTFTAVVFLIYILFITWLGPIEKFQ